jgi:hypothetical protein
MKRNLLIGIIGGAAIGAAASYLLEGDNRRGLVSGLSNRFNNLVGGEEESELLSGGSSENGSASHSNNNRNGGGNKRKSSTGRRG